MAASIMIAGVGGRTVVKGRSMAIPAAGPIPGRTPTNVPRMEPIRAKNKYSQDRALENPWNKRPAVSMISPVQIPINPAGRYMNKYFLKMT